MLPSSNASLRLVAVRLLSSTSRVSTSLASTVLTLATVSASAQQVVAAEELPTTDAQPTVEIRGVRAREKIGVSTLSSDELKKVPGSGGDPMRAVQVLPGVASINDASSEPAARGPAITCTTLTFYQLATCSM